MHTGVATWITALPSLAKLILLSHGSAIILGIYHIGKISTPQTHLCTDIAAVYVIACSWKQQRILYTDNRTIKLGYILTTHSIHPLKTIIRQEGTLHACCWVRGTGYGTSILTIWQGGKRNIRRNGAETKAGQEFRGVTKRWRTCETTCLVW